MKTLAALFLLLNLTTAFAQESGIPSTRELSRNEKDNTGIISLTTLSSCGPLVPMFACKCNTKKSVIMDVLSIDEEFYDVADVLNVRKISRIVRDGQMYCVYRVKVQY